MLAVVAVRGPGTSAFVTATTNGSRMSHDPTAGSETTTERFERLRRHPDPDLRNQLVLEHRWIAYYCARRFARRGEPLDDLVQVAFVGVLKAVERFDPSRGIAFPGFAIPTALGELRRHFRDKTWTVGFSRRVKDLTVRLSTETPVLAQHLGRTPSTDELAEHLQVTTQELCEALAASRSYRTLSLVPLMSDEESSGETLGEEDPDLEPDLTVLRHALSSLNDSDRRIIVWRFFSGLTQAEIASRLGTSQVQISRRLRRIFASLRETLQPVAEAS
jgi:RNA polymerase sigma-B factor